MSHEDQVSSISNKMGQGALSDPAAVLLGLSGDSSEAVESQREHYIRLLAADLRDSTTRLADLAYASVMQGSPGKFRIAVAGKSREELVESLRAAPLAAAVSERPRKVIFLFSGQGGQYPGMGGDLYRAVPIFREAVNACQSILASWGFDEMLQVIRGPHGSGEEAPRLEAEHTALFALEYGLAQMWMAWGVRPDVVLGQSLGEYIALVCSGALSLEDGLRLVYQRARMTRERCTPGSSGMLVVQADVAALEDVISRYKGLSVAAYNSDTSAIVGGDVEQIKALEDVCKKNDWWRRAIVIPYAYHTATMDPILDELRDLGKTVTFAPPAIPIVSAVHGVVVEIGDTSIFTSEYFAHHARRPVLFRESLYALAARDSELTSEGVWLEIGPHTTVLPLLKLHSTIQSGYIPVGSLRKGYADEEAVCQTLACLYSAGAPADWEVILQHLGHSAGM